ncbi:MAG: hypothetical protein U1F67_26270 [Rubrivivax sp.]
MTVSVFALVVGLGLDHADRPAIHQQHVVGRAAVGGVLAHRDAARRARIHGLEVLQQPAGLPQFLVDDFARLALGRHAGPPAVVSGV